MHHACFTMRVDPAHAAVYERMHREAWPELLAALHGSGWRNYGLWLREDGFLIGHLEAEDWTAAQAAMDADPVSPRWSVEMDRLVVAGTRMRWLEPEGTSAGHPLPLDAPRAVAVGTRPGDAPDDARTARFRDTDGTLVAYAEHPLDAERAAAAMLADPDPRPFRRVFDLETQFAALATITGDHR